MSATPPVLRELPGDEDDHRPSGKPFGQVFGRDGLGSAGDPSAVSLSLLQGDELAVHRHLADVRHTQDPGGESDGRLPGAILGPLENQVSLALGVGTIELGTGVMVGRGQLARDGGPDATSGALMNMPSGLVNLRDARPTVYLDLWVWIRLASAVAGRPRDPFDLRILAAVEEASTAGVAFPLSHTHYVEVGKIADPRQRENVARIMLSVSRFSALRSRGVLVRHQFLQAMHECFGRPTFRPTAPRVLGTGALWASLGEEAPLELRNAEGNRVDPNVLPGGAQFVRMANQFSEFKMLAGPQDAEVPDLRGYGYKPEKLAEAIVSRVDWEAEYKRILAGGPIDRNELRVRIQAREMSHEHLALISDLCREYRFDLFRAAGYDPNRPCSGRAGIVAFSDRIPTMRLAVDLKVELFRARRPWTPNAIHDIDALSEAVPYCHVVVPDGEMADLMSRSKVEQRTGTKIIHNVRQLPDALASLGEQAQSADLDPSHERLAKRGEQICFDEADLHVAAASRLGQRGGESKSADHQGP